MSNEIEYDSEEEEIYINMYKCQGCGKESDDPYFTECCEGKPVWCEGRDVVSGSWCKCNNRMDIRGRCCPIRSAPKFAKCNARCDTTYFCITNDYEAYKSYCDLPYSQQREKVFELAQKAPYYLTDHRADNVVYILTQDQKEEGYCCVKCDEPVDEEDRRGLNDDEGTELLYCEYCFDRLEAKQVDI